MKYTCDFCSDRKKVCTIYRHYGLWRQSNPQDYFIEGDDEDEDEDEEDDENAESEEEN